MSWDCLALASSILNGAIIVIFTLLNQLNQFSFTSSPKRPYFEYQSNSCKQMIQNRSKALYFIQMVKVGRQYKKVNGCSRQLECEQVFWVFGLAALIALYSTFVLPPILKWNNIPLIVFMAILYALFLPVIYDYFVLTCTDPVDQFVITGGGASDFQNKKCSMCNVYVKKETEHCLNCQRCTDQLDHHSQLINNCISSKNFSNYLRMNVCFCLSITIMMLESAIVFTVSFYNNEVNSYIINKWAIMVLLIMTFLSFIFSLYNSIFSCYLRWCKLMTRVKYRYRETSTNNSDLSDSEELSETSKDKEKGKEKERDSK